MNKFRTHHCSELSEKDLDKKVVISGWLHGKGIMEICFY